MKGAGKRSARSIAGRVLLGAVGLAFGYAAWVKIVDPAAFLSSILTFEVFSYRFAAWNALYVPWLELVLAFCLVSGLKRRAAVWLTGLLLMAFVALVAQARIRGLSIDCGCFGSTRLEDDFQYAWKFAENFLMLLALWIGAALLDESVAPSGAAEGSE